MPLAACRWRPSPAADQKLLLLLGFNHHLYQFDSS
jgi:hypothetical protein